MNIIIIAALITYSIITTRKLSHTKEELNLLKDHYASAKLDLVGLARMNDELRAQVRVYESSSK